MQILVYVIIIAIASGCIGFIIGARMMGNKMVGMVTKEFSAWKKEILKERKK
jgi:hypothetical protein